MLPATSKTLGEKYKEWKETIRNARDKALDYSGKLSLNRMQMLDVFTGVFDTIAKLDSLNTPELVAYAKAQESDTNLDINTEYTVVRASLVDLRDWLITNFPKDASGVCSTHTINAVNGATKVLLTAPQLSAVQTRLTNLAATLS
jgi:hypothetical protein